MSELSPSNDVFSWRQTLVSAKFDVWARRGLCVLHLEQSAKPYDDFLVDYANNCMASVHAQHLKRPPPYPADLILLELRSMLGVRIQSWRAEARKILVQRNAQRQGTAPDDRQTESRRPQGPVGPQVVARRKALVKEYREQRDLSVVAFARHASMSDTAIRGIVNEDWQRFSVSSQRRLLDLLGISAAEWYQE